ncbi:hypothetical protein P5673_025214 [Acropora cervicornis]|uniref:Uncharacterized protein n=1 Tax=Acropora cervicornis TaxID=6130 RepID=A0AAD9Q297_ACRCE|nr:hypothetical protein P5673_025214 [Acropora cervicornis]
MHPKQSHECSRDKIIPKKFSEENSMMPSSLSLKDNNLPINRRKTTPLKARECHPLLVLFIQKTRRFKSIGFDLLIFPTFPFLFLLYFLIDPYLSWDLNIDYLIKELNSRICLLKRARCLLQELFLLCLSIKNQQEAVKEHKKGMS